jgi:hypothetical protein
MTTELKATEINESRNPVSTRFLFEVMFMTAGTGIRLHENNPSLA